MTIEENMRLMQHERAMLVRDLEGERCRAREAERQRDEHRVSLNTIADILGVVHEDEKIVAAVAARLAR